MADIARASKWLTVGFGAAFVGFVATQEGSKPLAYADPGQGWRLPTICSGHTQGVKRGDRATVAQCQQYLAGDLTGAGREVARCVSAPITADQFDALVDFEFNTGKLCGSHLIELLNVGNCHGAARQFSLWINANGKPMQGLIRRRAAEREMFERDCKS
jgi:lysozyme